MTKSPFLKILAILKVFGEMLVFPIIWREARAAFSIDILQAIKL